MRSLLSFTLFAIVLVFAAAAEAQVPAEARDAPEPQVISEYHYLTLLRMPHMEAVSTARQVRMTTERPEMRALADSVIAALEEDIHQIERFLATRYPGEPLEVPFDAVMRRLEGAPPDQADHIFIEDLIIHHEMSIEASRELLEADEEVSPDVREFASQTIENMERGLERLRGLEQELSDR